MLRMVFFCIFLFIILLYSFQRLFIYIPPKTTIKRSHYQAQDMQDVLLLTDDKLSLLAWYKAAKSDLPTVIYFHGNAGHIGYRMPLARQLLNAGFGVLLVEYRGYAGNPGRPSEQGLYKDGRAAMRFLLGQNIQPEQVILYGESLGTGVATQIALEFPVCAVILQSPFTSLVEVATYHYPWLPLTPLDKYNSLARIDQINAALLIAHGQRDRIVPYHQGQELFQRALEPKKMLTFNHRGHLDLWNQQYYQQIVDFIKASWKSCLEKNNAQRLPLQ